MLPAPTGLNEDARLAALADYEIGGPPPEPAFAELLKLAARLFEVSTAFVSIVERDRQVFFVKTGIDACQTGRDIAFCSHTIARDECLVVLDARLDPRFHDNPLVLGEPFIRFYVGVPLRAPSGHAIGSLCLVDGKPRNRFSTEELSSLSDMANLVANLLESRRLELARRVGQSRFESIAATSPDGIICANEKGTITVWNEAATCLFGYPAAEAIGQSIDLIVPDELRGRHGGGMQRVVRGEEPRLIGKTIELPARHRDGTEFPIELSLSMWREEGRFAFGAIVRDLREQRVTEERLFRLTRCDPLTDLPNRAVLCERIADAIGHDQPVAVLLVDLDHFKDVNNTLGHGAGEELLRAVAETLTACVGSTDTVARLQEDEFVVMIPGCADPATAGRVADRINDRLALPQSIAGQKVVVSASIGIVMGFGGESTAEDLISCADLALLQARAAGGHCSRMFRPELKQTAIHKRTDRDDLHRATELREFELFYQPQVYLNDGRLSGAEALLRWRHPDKGLLGPAAFLAALENSRYAGEVGEWVLQEACRQANRWRKLVPKFRMGVNLFGAQCRTGDLAERVFDALDVSQLPVSGLEIEITENIILQHDDRQIGIFRTLRNAGVGIAFDDYGTGYASLSQLKLFPLTRLKIDQTFIRGMCGNKQDAAIVRAVISLSRSFELDVIAEGVETAEQQRRLLEKGCVEAQGYLFAKPLPPAEFEAQYGLQAFTGQPSGTGQRSPPIRRQKAPHASEWGLAASR